MNFFGRLIPWWAFVAAGAVAGALLAGMVQQLRVAGIKTEFADYKTAQAELWRQQAEMTNKVKDAVEAERQAKAADVAALDTRIAKEREDASAETERRLRGIAAGTVRVRYVAGSCPAASPVPATASAPGVADEPGVGLSPEAGQDVLLLRQSLAEDRAQIAGLKDYIRAACQ